MEWTKEELNRLNIGEINHIKDCVEKHLFEEKKVLEVGGVTPFEITNKLNVKSWTCVDPSRASDNIQGETYKQFKKTITEFSEDEGFDFIYSTNCFEHITNLEESISKMYDLLNPNGCLSALMGPIYSSYKGHHVFYNSPKYGLIDFNNIQLAPWGHLIYSKDELTDELAKHYDTETAEGISNQIINRTTINRLFFDDYAEIFNTSKFKIRELRDWHESKYPDKRTMEKLKKYNKKNFSTVSIKIILEK